MSVAEWRALLEALLDNRLSPEAFARRFLEGWRQARTRNTPQPIADMADAVEAFDAAAAERNEYETNADELLQAARRALSQLREPAVRTVDETQARAQMRQFAVHTSGCAGLGCFIALAWVGLCVLQIYFVSEVVQTQLGWGAAPSAIVGIFLAFVPVIGNVLAFIGATHYGWPPLLAAIVFFAVPAATLLSGWARWRRGLRG